MFGDTLLAKHQCYLSYPQLDHGNFPRSNLPSRWFQDLQRPCTPYHGLRLKYIKCDAGSVVMICTPHCQVSVPVAISWFLGWQFTWYILIYLLFFLRRSMEKRRPGIRALHPGVPLLNWEASPQDTFMNTSQSQKLNRCYHLTWPDHSGYGHPWLRPWEGLVYPFCYRKKDANGIV